MSHAIINTPFRCQVQSITAEQLAEIKRGGGYTVSFRMEINDPTFLTTLKIGDKLTIESKIIGVEKYEQD